MTGLPYVLLSCAISADGYLDDAAGDRLVLSSEADADRVDEVRAGVDAILVGAGTVRRDNPRLLVRSRRRRDERAARGLAPGPVKVTLTMTGDLDPAANFFTAGDSEKLVYCATPAFEATRARLARGGAPAAASGGTPAGASGGAPAATPIVIDAGNPPSLRNILVDLAERGVGRLMVEGGASILTQFLTDRLADELQLVVAPLLVGDPAAPRFAGPAGHPRDARTRMTLAEVRRLGDVVLMRYLFGPSATDRRWLRAAVEISRHCPPSPRAYSVGAVVVDRAGDLVATGYSRESDSDDHAEEVALRKAAATLPDERGLAGATLYSSLEPCSVRASRPRTCTELILAAGMDRVVFAWREPALFADCRGAEILRDAGVTVTEMPEFADQVRAVNAHLFGRSTQS